MARRARVHPAGDTRELQRAQRWQNQFGDAYYLEVSRCGRTDEEQHLRRLLDIAALSGIGVVATNDVCFAEPEDFEALSQPVAAAPQGGPQGRGE